MTGLPDQSYLHYSTPRGPHPYPNPSDPLFRINCFSFELHLDFFKLSGLLHPPLLLYMAIQSAVLWLVACESQSRMSQRIEAVNEVISSVGKSSCQLSI
jgi:hypothetical protein